MFYTGTRQFDNVLAMMRALEELSSFTSLSCLMKVLATVAVTSCSAERVMSCVRIIKKQTVARCLMTGSRH